MADLEVQPKKKNSILPWLLLGLGLLALIIFLVRGCGDTAETVAVTDDSLNNTTGNTATGVTVPENATNGNWNDVDFNAPAVQYDEITNKDINVRGTGNYAIYGLGENILFDENKSTIRSDAEQNLKQIATSVGKRYNGGAIRIYGYTDAQGSAGYNKELAEQRAEAVRGWMVKNGITESNISVHPVGESNPVASNSTEAGRQQNRRVEIVARGTGAAQ